MKKFKPLKIHFYSYRFIFMFYWIILIAVYLLSKLIIFKENNMTGLVILLTSIVFSLFIGSYEYNIISNSYLSLKTNRKNFFINSIIFSIISSCLLIVSIILIGLINQLLLKDHLFTQEDITLYISLFLILICLHYLGNFYSLILKRFSFLTKTLATLFTLALILKGSIIYETLIKALQWMLDYNNLSIITFASISFIIIINLINYYKFAIKY